jgi:hypothetical protein
MTLTTSEGARMWQGSVKPADGRTLARMIEDAKGAPGWAVDLPDDPATFHVADNRTAQRLQEEIRSIDQFGGWSVSHMCIMHLIARFSAHLPTRYLEIGVNDGLSVFALVTSINLQRALHRLSAADPLFDELALADDWGRAFGGSGRGSHQHVEQLLRSTNARAEHLVFLDGDSKETVPRYLAARQGQPPFDVIYVDGDHSYDGARIDLQNVIPFVGQILFFDDMYHPAHCLADRLLELHISIVEQLKHDFYVVLNRRWFGFAAFLRKQLVDALGD